MVEADDRGTLLRSLKGYLADLVESGVDELHFAPPSKPAAVVEPQQVPEPLRASDPVPAAVARPVAAPGFSCRVDGDRAARLFIVMAGDGFDGEAGGLLEKIVRAMGLSPETVCLVTGPFGGGDAEGWRAAILERIESAGPEVVVALGEEAVMLLTLGNVPLKRLRGKFQECHGFQLMPSYHPEALLADETLKRDVWNDMKQVMARLQQGR